MRRAFAAVLIALVLIGLAPSRAAEPWRPGVPRAIDYSTTRAGEVSFAVIGPAGREYGYRRVRTVPAASIIKVMFLAAYLRHPHVRGRALNERDRSLLKPMITRSDNASASTIADYVGARRINRLAEVTEMDHFNYTRPWGLSRVNAIEQARFMFHLERYIPKRHEDYARYLLAHVVDAQRWGIGRLNRPNWRFYFKGGWGSGTGAVCHQVAFLERGEKGIAVAIMITNSPGHEYATETLRAIADRLLDELPAP